MFQSIQCNPLDLGPVDLRGVAFSVKGEDDLIPLMDNRTVVAQNYRMVFKNVSDTALFFSRRRTLPAELRLIECFANNWALIRGEFAPGQVAFFARDQRIEGRRQDSLVLPPGSVIEWRVGAGPVEMLALSSVQEWPRHLPHRPFIARDFLFDEEQPVEGILSRLARHEVMVDVFRANTANTYALKLHKFLLVEYGLNRSMDDYAKLLGLSKEALIRYFTACFGLSPVKMRQGMRMNRAFAQLMLRSKSVSEVSGETGFNSLSYFYREFRRTIGLAPGVLVDGPRGVKAPEVESI